MIPIAPQEREREHGVPSYTSNEQLRQNPPDLHSDPRRLEGQGLAEHEAQGLVTIQPSVVAPERAFNDDQFGDGTQDSVPHRRYGGECWCPGNIISINTDQTRRKYLGARRSKLSPSPSMSQKSPQADLIPSKSS